MDLICLLASPHGLHGNTARLLQHVIEGAQSAGATAETIVLDGRNVRPCNGCDACHKVGRCVQQDEFEAIHARIDAADGLVIASPNYIFNVSAQLKAFMDRCCGIIHCLSFGGKYGAAVVTSGGGGDDPVIDYMNRFLMVTGIRPVGGVHATMGGLPEGVFTAGLVLEAEQLGQRLVDAWQRQAVDPSVERQIRVFSERMRELVFWKKEEWPHEYRIWQQREGG